MPFETFFRLVEGQGHMGQIEVITGTFMHGLQNNFAQLLSSRRRSAN